MKPSENSKNNISKKAPWKSTDFFTATLVTFFGTGTFPKMPGTYGSLAAAIIAYPLSTLSFRFLFLILSVALFFIAIPFVNKAMRDSKVHDPGWIVIDEVVGVWVALAFVPPEWIYQNPWVLLIAFAAFRFFDILKPLGIHQLEKLPKAYGVMADDLLGGIYSGILLLLIYKLC